ncbi:hypothetical protein JK358_05135 [Nocardia sp. 2]|uniref:Uncharacterized protein n=1 Tax=Nocardia acididurans TaxID=2802282 RepID=A0ABS1LZV0_9NOCA|nr:hypothetical protein [Nocardia acididurans]MBL1073771.1 hypothetical protein [Nocardia acididurans]
MTTASRTPAAGRLHRPLLMTTVLMAVLTVFCVFAMAFDDRMLLNESVWLKPMKFAIAFTLYAGTLAWLLSFPHKGKRLTWWMGAIFSLTAIVDVGFIVVQAARGTFSHFNDSEDAVNTIGQQIFQSGVPGLFLANLVIALVLSWQKITDRPTSRAIHAGLGIAVAGMFLGYFMGFTGKQQATDAYGKPVDLVAGHTVVEGQPALRDGVDTMPVTHWSTNGGDMRIAHFLGLHGIQILILASFALAWFAPRVPWLRGERARADLIWVLALGYSGLLAITFWQALRGQAVTAPDAATLGALAAVAAFVAAGFGLVYAVRGRAALVPSLTDAGTSADSEISAAAPRPVSASPMSR